MTDDLKFTGEIPVVINRNGSADDVFAPVRSSSCDINIVSKEILDDLYTANKDEMKVRIEKDLYEINEETIHHDAWVKRELIRPAWDEEVFHPAHTEEVYHPAWVEVGTVDKHWEYENNGIIQVNKDVWHDFDGHIYYSEYRIDGGIVRGQYYYQLINDVWVEKNQNEEGISGNINGADVWYDNGHIYYASSEFIDGRWEQNGDHLNLLGRYVWYDNGHIYYSEGQGVSGYEIINQELHSVSGLKYINGRYIWHYDGHTYYSPFSALYSQEFVNGQWVEKNWNIRVCADYIWKDNDGHIYYSNVENTGSQIGQYELVNDQWVEKTWNKTIYGNYILNDGTGHIYHTHESYSYELVDGRWVDHNMHLSGTAGPGFDGEYFWHDNNGHMYYTYGDFSYELVNDVWVLKNWYKTIYGCYVWNDNDGHTYYSSGDEQYVLFSGGWYSKSWNHNVYGNCVWQDNDGHIYYNYDSANGYELINGRWENKTWNKGIHGEHIFRDENDNIYFNYGGNKGYKLVNGQWKDITWNKNNISTSYIWNDAYGFAFYTRVVRGDDSDSDVYYAYKLVNGRWVDTDEFDLLNKPLDRGNVWTHNNHTYSSGQVSIPNPYGIGRLQLTRRHYEIGEVHHPEWTEILHYPEWTEIVHHPDEYKTTVIWPAWDQVVKTKSKIGTEPVWEGYMTPNTYSQEVTQNLDEISMTAIDPVSLLKFIHIDKIMSKPNICTYGEIIGKALALVKLDSDILYVENNVSYESNTLLDMKVRVGNFWDEDGETSTVYDAIGEMLKIFGCCLVFQGDSYLIYDLTKNSDTSERTYSEYTIEDNGTLTFVSNSTIGITKLDVDDWTSNNTSIPTVEIRETYDKVTAVASTSIPEYSSNIMDIIDSMERDLYDIGHLNIELNTIKGYRDTQWPWTQFTLDTNPHWYYIWNGTYINSDYGLETNYMVDGWNNINAFYEYLNGESRYPSETGSILNFYGSADNPTATGRRQEEEKTVEIKKKITSFAPDNGVPPELLERSDTRWYYENNYEEEDPRTGTHNQFSPSNLRPELYIYDDTNVKFGHSSDAVVSRPVYIQEYENMVFNSLNSQTIEINLMQGYSRTGQNDPIPMITGSTVEDVLFRKEDGYIDIDSFSSGNNNKVYCWPRTWRDDEVLVNRMYFNRSEWVTSSATLLKPIWDRRRVDVTMEVNNITYQFDGKRWYQLGDNESPSVQHAFFLKKLMNGEKIFIDDFKYNIIETSDGSEYSLEDEAFIYYTDTYGSVCEEDDSGARSNIIDVYVKDGYSWSSQVKCDEGYLSIITHNVDGINGKVKVVIYSSSLLGISGMETHSDYSYENRDAIYYNINGTLREVTSDQTLPDRPLTQEDFPYTFNTPTEKILSYKFMPICVSYIKAEHLDLDVSISVPKSNLGQMFEESDIKYVINLNRNYQEQYEGLNFKVNTKHGFVANSYSYLIGQNEVANPDLFVINGVNVRPECYVTQAYLNYLSNIRKIYSKTMVSDEDIDNVQTYIRTPEINGDKWMRVLSDSYDLKTGRHSIVAVESNDMEVSALSNFSSMEIPRRARSERYNYISSNKKK